MKRKLTEMYMNVVAFMAISIAVIPAAQSQTAGKAQEAEHKVLQARMDAATIRKNINTNVVSIVTGSPGGTYAKIASELAYVISQDFYENSQFRLIPMLSNGSVQNLIDLAYLRKTHLALVQNDVLHVAGDGLFPNLVDWKTIRNKVRYITKLYEEEIHLLTRKEFGRVEDLDDKKVAVGLEYSGSALTALAVFEGKGRYFEPDERIGDQAIHALLEEKIDAIFMVVGKPAPIFENINQEDKEKLHFIDISVPQELLDEGIYSTAKLTNKDYPLLVGESEEIDTISVSAVLATYDYDRDTLDRDLARLMHEGLANVA